MTAILGISAFYHDAAAALVLDGEIVAAAQEERFTRVKHDESFPRQALEYCLAEGGLEPAEIDFVGFYDKPLLKFDRLLQTYLMYAPRGFLSFSRALPVWLKQKIFTARQLHEGLRKAYDKRFIFTEHHESHAASAFFPSPFEEAAILTLDGVGEWATGALGIGRDNHIDLLAEMRFPHSLGLLYSAFTSYAGFKVNSGEYKLMGLAPYGEPRYAGLILEHLLELRDDGSFRMDMRYFNYCQGLTMTSGRFHDLFGGPPRKPEDPITQRDMDIAASIQEVTNEVVLRAGRHLHSLTGAKKLCMAGGVALNCVSNKWLLEEGPFEDIWVQPAAGDAGGALGAALFIWHQLLGSERIPAEGDGQAGSLLGRRFSATEVASTLQSAGARFELIQDSAELCDRVAELLAEGKVIGWFQGRMEFGPRALGSRSILADPRSAEMQSVLNVKIKFRESFRPFAPSVLSEHAAEWFEMGRSTESPYMLFVMPVAGPRRRSTVDDPGEGQGLDKLKVLRSDIPAVTHVDYSARLQTVDRSRHGRFRLLLEAFWRRTGCPVLINTSFNVRGEPIVNTPEEAYRCFMATDMDALVAEDFILLKEDQPRSTAAMGEHLRQFALD